MWLQMMAMKVIQKCVKNRCCLSIIGVCDNIKVCEGVDVVGYSNRCAKDVEKGSIGMLPRHK